MSFFADQLRLPGGPLGWCRRRLVQRLGAWLLLLGFLPLATGGCTYYRTREQPTEALSQLADHKLFIVHRGPAAWQLRAPRLDAAALSGQLAPAPPELAAAGFLHPEDPRVRHWRYRPNQSAVALNLVHVYLRDDAPLPGEAGGGGNSQAGPAADSSAGRAVRLPLSGIQEVRITEQDTGVTIASYVATGAGITAGALAILLVIIALTKSSCPFVYADNGQGSYQFVGETYGGAIFAPAERPDYMPLPAIQPTAGGEYRLKISNELKERQYTNLAELLVAQHPAGTRVLLDQSGQPQTLRDLRPPLAATTGAGLDCRAALQAPDQAAALFDDQTGPANAPSSVVMSFANPGAARQARLVLRAQNSLWLDYLYGRFIEQFGGYYNIWAAGQRTEPAATGARWTQEQHIPLRVYVEVAGRWQLAGTVPTVGPLAARDVVVPLTLDPAARPGAPVRVRLETGFMFWEVNYAALDLGPAVPVQLTRCAPVSARTEAGTDVRAALLAADDQYLAQLRPGTEVSLRYHPELPATPAGTARTVFLHTQGYYEHIRDFHGLPDVLALQAFERPGRFVEFSKELYQQTARAPAFAAAR